MLGVRELLKESGDIFPGLLRKGEEITEVLPMGKAYQGRIGRRIDPQTIMLVVAGRMVDA